MIFEDIYKPPFKPMPDGFSISSDSGVKTFTAFAPSAQEHLARVMKILNGEPGIEKYNKNDVVSQGTKLCICGDIILIRGWGALTGVGGYHIPREEAAKIQDDFIKWVINTITK